MKTGTWSRTMGLLIPDVGPPRALRSRTDHGALFREGLLLGRVECLAEFAVRFVLVGPGEFHDLFGGRQGNEAFLPVVVAALDFAFGVGVRRGV
jgi:hypothetical protein